MNFEKDTTFYGIASAFLGAVGMIAWLIPLFGSAISGIAIYTGVKAISNEEDGWPLAGIALGVVSFILAVFRSGLVYFYG